MRIPEEHILTLELCRLYKLKLGPFNDIRTKFLFHDHHNSLMDFLHLFTKSSDCSFFGSDCKGKLKKVGDLFKEVSKDYTCLPFDQFIEKYDWYDNGNWLKEKLPEFSTNERVHYTAITNMGSGLKDNIINTVTTAVLHYEQV